MKLMRNIEETKVVVQINPDILETQPFLKGMTATQLEKLAEDSMPTEFNAGERIYIYGGGSANHFYLILEGRVELKTPVTGGGAPYIQTLGPGDILGWSWLFPQQFRHCDARALTPIKAIFFYGRQLRELCEKDHDVGCELMKVFWESASDDCRERATNWWTPLTALGRGFRG
jgi:CRP/FNR family transcriptional regulator, cyclic AMP receptor protein